MGYNCHTYFDVTAEQFKLTFTNSCLALLDSTSAVRCLIVMLHKE